MKTGLKWFIGIAFGLFAMLFLAVVVLIGGSFLFKGFAERSLLMLPFEGLNSLRIWHNLEPLRPRDIPNTHHWVKPHWEPIHKPEPHVEPHNHHFREE